MGTERNSEDTAGFGKNAWAERPKRTNGKPISFTGNTVFDEAAEGTV
jgi:hypothetical protein